jgi:hypothetical protein
MNFKEKALWEEQAGKDGMVPSKWTNFKEK